MERKFAVNDKVVILESTWAALQMLDETEQMEALRLFLNYSFYEEDAVTENPHVQMFLLQAMALANVFNQKCGKAVENGKLGGRPVEYDIEKILKFKTNGYTNNQIAKELGCHINTVKTAIRNYKENGTPTISEEDIVSFIKKHLHD